MSLPAACQGCKREGKQIEYCQVRTYQFAALLKKCPREPGFEPAPIPKPITKGIEPLATTISIADLETGVFSPRMQFDPKYVAKLAEDIEAEGQLKPIMVRPHPTEPNKYQVIDGEHRVRALQKLGKTLIRAELHALSNEEAYYRAMRINQLHGKALEELEEATHVSKMMALFGYTQEQIGKRFGRDQTWVSRQLSLVKNLAPETEKAVMNRFINPTQAIDLAELPKEEQGKITQVVAEKKLSTRATRGLVHAIKEAPQEQKKQILEKPLEVYATQFKDPKTLTKALLTIKPDDDFLAKSKEIKTEEQAKKFWGESKPEEALKIFECPGCGKKLCVDWAKGEVRWD